MEYTENMMIAIDEALKDGDFCNKLAETTRAAEIKALFLEKGIEVDDELANAAFKQKERVLAGEELSEEELELVAGGCRKCWAAWAGAGALAGIAGGPIGVAAGFCAGSAAGINYGIKHDLGR